MGAESKVKHLVEVRLSPEPGGIFGRAVADSEPIEDSALLSQWYSIGNRSPGGHTIRAPQGHLSTQWRAVQVRRVGN